VIRGNTALVVEGGAFRSVFAAGLLDGFIEASFNPFDFCIGVSAGAACALGFLAGRQQLAFQTLQKISRDKRFFNPGQFILGGHLLDMDWLFNGPINDLIDTDACRSASDSLIIAMTDVASGRSVYHEGQPGLLATALKASMSLPVLYRDFPRYAGRPMTDGGIADGIPVAEAVRRGAKRIMVIRSRPAAYTKFDTPWHKFLRWKLRSYPELTAVMRRRIDLHEQVKHYLAHMPQGVKLYDICPPPDWRQGRFDRASQKLDVGYRLGRDRAATAISAWQQD